MKQITMFFKSLNKYQIMSLVVGIILLVSVPLSVYLVQKQTQLKSKASVSSGQQIILTPKAITTNLPIAGILVNDSFNLDIELNAGSKTITGAELKLKFNSNILEATSITFPQQADNPFNVSVFPTGLQSGFQNTSSQGVIRFAAVHDPDTTTFNNLQKKIATVTFKAKNPGVGYIDLSNVDPTDVMIVAQGESGKITDLVNPVAVINVTLPPGARTVDYTVSQPAPPYRVGSLFELQMTRRSPEDPYVALKVQRQSGVRSYTSYEGISNIPDTYPQGYVWSSTTLEVGKYTFTLMSGCDYHEAGPPTCTKGSPYNSLTDVDILPPAGYCTSNANCSDAEVCDTTNHVCVSPTCPGIPAGDNIDCNQHVFTNHECRTINAANGTTCNKLDEASGTCQNGECVVVVNGGWSDFGPCSATACGTTGTHTRTCNSPPPDNGGAECAKADHSLTTPVNRVESQSCTNAACAAIPADYNGDRCVDTDDYTTWVSINGQSRGLRPPYQTVGGTVNIEDYRYWLDQYDNGHGENVCHQ